MHSLRLLVCVALLVAAGCEAVPPPGSGSPAADEPIVFTPDSDVLAPFVAVAAARWAAATGLDIRVGDGGIPWVLVDRLPTGTGTESLGATAADRSEVLIHVRGKYAWPRTVLHEMGHALWGDHVDSMGVLSYHDGYEPIIDTASLESVCERLPCAAFSPEAP